MATYSGGAGPEGCAVEHMQVEADLAVARRLHADDFRLINPGGAARTKDQHLGGIAPGEIDYRIREPDATVEVLLYGQAVLIRNRSRLEIVVGRTTTLPLRGYWHS
jgi:hypothetical protein